jgi:glyoxylase-like metal-dependent hydrolase (beta-lactamase superfamily II)
MAAIATTNTDLRWDVLTVKRPGLTRDLPPGKEELMWVANSSTLIQGERDAVLVDTLLTTEQSKTLSDWVVASGKNLTAIYITHGHGDHFFGLASLLERFPRAKAVAKPEVVRAMREQLTPAWIDNFWRRLFPATFRTAFWLLSRSKETIWSWRGASLSRLMRGEPIRLTPHACTSRRSD